MQPQLPLYLPNSGALLLDRCNEVPLGRLCCLKLLIEGLAEEVRLMLQQHCLTHLAGWRGQLQAAVQKPTAPPSTQQIIRFLLYCHCVPYNTAKVRFVRYCHCAPFNTAVDQVFTVLPLCPLQHSKGQVSAVLP